MYVCVCQCVRVSVHVYAACRRPSVSWLMCSDTISDSTNNGCDETGTWLLQVNIEYLHALLRITKECYLPFLFLFILLGICYSLSICFPFWFALLYCSVLFFLKVCCLYCISFKWLMILYCYSVYRRFIFNWAHWGVGYMAEILASKFLTFFNRPCSF